MNKMLAAAVTSIMMASSPAVADIILSYENNFTFGAHLAIGFDDGSYANGVAISRHGTGLGHIIADDLIGTGITSFSLFVFSSPLAMVATLDTFNHPITPFATTFRWDIILDSAPGQMPHGVIFYANEYDEFHVFVGPGSAPGTFSTEFGRCIVKCFFDGSFKATEAPEPWGIALFGVGLLGLGVALRSRASAMITD